MSKIISRVGIEDCVYEALDKQVSKKIIKEVVRETFESILFEIVKGNKVSITGFGRFKPIIKKGITPIAGKYERFTISFITSLKTKKKLNALKGFLKKDMK